MPVMRRLIFVFGFAASVTLAAQPPAPLDAAFAAFWNADAPAAAAKIADRIVATGASFEAVASRLKAGRPYGKQKTGRVELPSRVYGMALDNVAEVPAEYDAARPIALRVTLHGGVGRPAPG